MRKLITLALVAGMAPFAFADGNHASTTATVSLNIFAPVSICKEADLNLGVVVLDDLHKPATVTVQTSGNGSNAAAVRYHGCAPLTSISGQYMNSGHGVGNDPHQGVFNFTWDSRVKDVHLWIDHTVRLEGGHIPLWLHTNDTTADSRPGGTNWWGGNHHHATQTNSFAFGGTVFIPGADGMQVGNYWGIVHGGVNYL